ncbi:TPA: SpoIIIAH-like family protein [Candidatus Ventrenecus avicola]|nr:SpoIIIAH-like family protein [Candidatus Ventrenecus avicola]
MINKQSVWFVTLFSLILVLSIYYVTMNDNSLASILENTNTTTTTSLPVNSEIEESSLLVSLRVEEDEAVLEEMENYQSVLLDTTTTTEEKNNAYNSLMALNQKKADEEKIEKTIKETYQLDSFAKVKDDTISITIASSEHSTTLANNIIRTVQELFEDQKYITVKFQTS